MKTLTRVLPAMLALSTLTVSPEAAADSQRSAESIVICKLFNLLPGTDCHGDNLGPAKGPIDDSHLTDWWETAGPWKGITDQALAGKIADLIADQGKEGLKKAWEFFAGGDPHMVSLDGQGFDMLLRGDYLYSAFGEGTGYVEIQGRHQGTEDASVIGAIAVQLGEDSSHVVELYAGHKKLLIDGEPVNIPREGVAYLADEDGILLAIVRDGSDYTILHRDQHVIALSRTAAGLVIDATVMLSPDDEIHGAMGDRSGLRFASGVPVQPPLSAAQWVRYQDDWEVTGASLLSYDAWEVAVPELVEGPSWEGAWTDGELSALADALVGDASRWTVEACLHDLIRLGPSEAVQEMCLRMPAQVDAVIATAD